jgi:hypothetical protein
MTFDPVAVGNRECDAWIAYYRHEWRSFLIAAVAMVRAGFAMDPARTVAGAWLVLRANQVWAPYPDNDPDRARELMRRFYTLVERSSDLGLDPAEAARREVAWWHVHRVHQREHDLTEDDLVAALVDLYSYVYRADPTAVRPAAMLRVLAMRLSDEWMESGCDRASPLLRDERRALVASYAALREAVDRGAPSTSGGSESEG